MQVLESLLDNFKTELNSIQKIADLLNLKAKYIGKQGPLADVMKNIKDASPEEKRTLGSKANELKNTIEAMVSEKMVELETAEMNQSLLKNKVDF